MCLLEHAAQESSHASEALEVVGAQFAGLIGADVQLLGETEAREAVRQAVGHCLDLGTLLGGDVLGGNAEDFGADVTVQVLPRFVGGDELLVGGEVHHDAHFDLRVVGGEQTLVLHTVDGCGRDDEGATDAAAFLGADRDVLQVRRGRGESTGGGGTLLEGGVHASVVGGCFLQAFDGLNELDVVAVGGERTEECGTVGLRGDFGE